MRPILKKNSPMQNRNFKRVMLANSLDAKLEDKKIVLPQVRRPKLQVNRSKVKDYSLG